MIGKKIYNARTKLGLSQKQLAGEDMTRAYISLIEKGHANPSEKMLRIIAKRLNKPVEFFLGKVNSDTTDLSFAILQGAKSKYSSEEFTSCDGMVSRLLIMTQDTNILAEAYYLKICCKNSTERYYEALDVFDDSLPIFLEFGDRRLLTLLYLERGKASFHTEDFVVARKSYEQAIKYSNQLKKLQDEKIKALTYLGTTLIRLGEIKEAISAYTEAEKEVSFTGDIETHGNVALGLGKAYFLDNVIEKSLSWTEKSIELFNVIKSESHVQALHNLAVIQSKTNHSNEESLNSLYQCYSIYEKQNMPNKQASILEEIANHWVARRNLQKAKDCCKQGIKLLEVKDDGILRARLYRLLGTILRIENNEDQSYYCLRMSYDLFIRLKAFKEASISMDMLN